MWTKYASRKRTPFIGGNGKPRPASRKKTPWIGGIGVEEAEVWGLIILLLPPFTFKRRQLTPLQPQQLSTPPSLQAR
jgi:hypothetical protein